MSDSDRVWELANKISIAMLASWDAQSRTDTCGLLGHAGQSRPHGEDGGRSDDRLRAGYRREQQGCDVMTRISAIGDPEEIPPATPGHPTEPPPEDPSGNPRPEVPPPMNDPAEPSHPNELPGRMPDELPVRGPKGPPAPNPAN